MRPQELRVGNLVNYNGEVVRVEQITKKKIGYHRHKGETRMNYARLFEVEPIPITEELLKKNGFEIDQNLKPVLSETLAGRDNIEIIFKDVMKISMKDAQVYSFIFE